MTRQSNTKCPKWHQPMSLCTICVRLTCHVDPRFLLVLWRLAPSLVTGLLYLEQAHGSQLPYQETWSTHPYFFFLVRVLDHPPINVSSGKNFIDFGCPNNIVCLGSWCVHVVWYTCHGEGESFNFRSISKQRQGHWFACLTRFLWDLAIVVVRLSFFEELFFGETLELIN